MTTPAMLALQKAIYETLTAALAPVKVYDNVPQGAAFPYVTIGEDTAVDWSTKASAGTTGAGVNATIIIHTWSRYPGKTETKTLQGKVKSALNNANLTLDTQTLTLIRFEFEQTFMDEDGQTRHGVQHFRALASDEP